MSISLTGHDVIQIDDRILSDLADGDCVTLTSPTDIAAVKTSKNGNMIYALNESGRVCEVTVRLLLGSADDKYLNSRLQAMKSDFSSFILLTGAFTKCVGDGKGKVNKVVYQCSGGVFKKQPEQKTNVDGNPDQSVVVYTITFGNGPRSIQ